MNPGNSSGIPQVPSVDCTSQPNILTTGAIEVTGCTTQFVLLMQIDPTIPDLQSQATSATNVSQVPKVRALAADNFVTFIHIAHSVASPQVVEIFWFAPAVLAMNNAQIGSVMQMLHQLYPSVRTRGGITRQEYEAVGRETATFGMLARIVPRSTRNRYNIDRYSNSDGSARTTEIVYRPSQ